MAPQLTYDYAMPAGYPGQRADADSYSALNRSALLAVAFGLGLVQCAAVGSELKARVPNPNSLTLTFSVDFVASNVINGNVVATSPAGVATTTALSATTYATSHAATIAALAAKIAAVTGVASAVAAGDVITVTATADYALDLTGFVVTAGAGQPTVAVVASTTDRFLGIGMHTQVQVSPTGIARYEAGDVMPVAGKGRFFATAEQTMVVTDPVYCRYKAGTGTVIGSFRKDADSGTAVLVPQARWLSSASAGNIAVIEFNLP